MNLSTNSWHYKLCDALDVTPSNSLCVYFWQIVYSIFLAILMTTMGVVLAVIYTFIITMPITVNLITLDPGLVILFTALSIFAWYETIFEPLENYFYNSSWNISLWEKKHTFTSKSESIMLKQHVPVKEKSVLEEYIKAKKEKICPVIEWDNYD